ncbi:Zinc finger protein-like 1 [Orchesella cincta]|uniref:Zinc finger protein-like 1 homolog n=1 Tax=Orchesella cincta TaxID=48709 RepID=A0A1D2ND42_ORCCI|nr:Zinc finger protein-like 1 [Orchesella cincta]
MGLCKCPQRKVTNIFCYEHRVNVCEHCLMQNHPKCVVDTYRNWITDSVFSPKCTLCSDDLVNGETVRLLCFRKYCALACLDSWARSLPATTAPAGYTCPVCERMCLFPALNQVSPIADALRDRLAEVNWARVGLGLPLLDSDTTSFSPQRIAVANGSAVAEANHQNSLVSSGKMDSNRNPEITRHEEIPYQSNIHTGSLSPTPGTHGTSVMKNNLNMSSNHIEPSTSYPSNHAPYTPSPQSSKSFYGDMSSGNAASTPNPRKPVSKYDYEMPLLFDEDEHKYRRKSPFEALSRWLKNANPASSRRKSRRRTIVYAIVTIIVLIVMFMILFGRNEEYDDEGFDPKLNPNVIIGEREAVGKNSAHEDS